MVLLWLGFMLKNKFMIQEDFERDFLKDAIYLQETAIEIEKDLLELKEDVRKAAIISVIKVKDETRVDVLPF